MGVVLEYLYVFIIMFNSTSESVSRVEDIRSSLPSSSLISLFSLLILKLVSSILRLVNLV